eukprot:1261622-Rhodomonas_salina.1
MLLSGATRPELPPAAIWSYTPRRCSYAIRPPPSPSNASHNVRLYTLLPTPYTLHPTPYTLHPTPYSPHPTPYALHP